MGSIQKQSHFLFYVYCSAWGVIFLVLCTKCKFAFYSFFNAVFPVDWGRRKSGALSQNWENRVGLLGMSLPPVFVHLLSGSHRQQVVDSSNSSLQGSGRRLSVYALAVG